MAKRIFGAVALAMMALAATGCVALLYTHETVSSDETRREAGLLSVPGLETPWGHGLIPLYVETHRKGEPAAPRRPAAE